MKKILVLLLLILTHSTICEETNPFWGINIEGFPICSRKLSSYKRKLPLNIKVFNFYLAWSGADHFDDSEKLLSTLQDISNSNAIASITWEPEIYDNGNKKAVYYKDILDGKYDNYIIEFADTIKSFEKVVFLRFMHEMNLNTYHWGVEESNYNENYPKIYKSIYRYVANIFKRNSIDNVIWIFCPNCTSVPNEPWNNLINYYPGDRYVDVLGMDGYNWGTTQTLEKDGWNSQWQSFSSIFLQTFIELRKIAPSKSIIVCETASVEDKRDRWIEEAIETSKKWDIKGILWFQVNKENKWSLTTTEAKDIFEKYPNNLSQDDIIRELIYEKKSINR